MTTEKSSILDLEAGPTSTYGATNNKPSKPPGEKMPQSRRALGIQRKEVMLEQKKKLNGERVRPAAPSAHTPLYSMLRRHSHRWYAYAYRLLCRTLICITVVNYLLESDSRLQKRWLSYFHIFDAIVSTVFMLEYFAKVMTAPEREKLSKEEQPRINFLFSSESFIDVLSFAPFFVEILFGVNPAKYDTVRMSGLIRLLKLPILWDALRMCHRVFYYNARILVSSFLVCFIMLLVSAAALYYTRPPSQGPLVDTRDNFHSILACMYLAILMLTGQGEPNGTMPWYTRIIICLTAIFAIAQFAIPASMLTWGFEQEAEHAIVKKNDKEKKVAEKLSKGLELPLSSSSSDEADRADEWNGYLENLDLVSETSEEEGEKEEEEDEKGKQLEGSKTGDERILAGQVHSLTPAEMKRAKRIFVKLDTDNDSLINAEKLRAITEGEKEAGDLFKKLRSFVSSEVGGDKPDKLEVSIGEFILWLDFVKTKYHRYGDKIFLGLLNKLERKLHGTSRAAKKPVSRWQTAGKVAGMLKAPHAATVTKESDELKHVAENFCELDRANAELQRKVAALEAEVTSLQAV